MKLFSSIFLMPAIILILLSGCATNAIDPKDETLSMVYGYIGGNVSLFGPVKWATLKENSEPAAYHDLNIERDFLEKGGIFWHMGVKPGSYQLDDFGLPDMTFYYGKASKNDTVIRVTKPGIYFMGSYWHENNNKIIAQSTFDIKRINKPSERELVQRLIKKFEAEGDNKTYVRQYNFLKKRLAELPK